MTFPFARIAILGPGLLGGSLALALRRVAPNAELRLWGRRPEVLAEARELGIADHTSTSAIEAAQDADLVIFCTPIGFMPVLAKELATQTWPAETVFTDVGSVKGSVVRALAPLLAHCGQGFLGSHPMAGSEKTGLSAAFAELFQGACCILTPTLETSADSLTRLEAFWRGVGCRIIQLSPEAHDETVARISHLPHLAAAAIVLAGLKGMPEAARCSGSGFRDTTRVASGAPDMWTEILLENREAVTSSVEALHSQLGEVLAKLRNLDEIGVRNFLGEAKALRDQWFPANNRPSF